MTALEAVARETLAEMFRQLGDPTRLGILLACMPGERNVGTIAEEIGASPSLVSHHLRLLRATRLVRSRRAGKEIFYDVADGHVRRILSDMIEHATHPDCEPDNEE